MSQTTSVFLNGQPVKRDHITGVSTSPNIYHRHDFGIDLERANGSLGAFRGDIAEVAIYNTSLEND